MGIAQKIMHILMAYKINFECDFTDEFIMICNTSLDIHFSISNQKVSCELPNGFKYNQVPISDYSIGILIEKLEGYLGYIQ